MTADSLIVRPMGKQAYLPVWQHMRDFTDQRVADQPDECWWLEHEPVFTLGQAGKESHILSLSDIPVIRTDRGGQVTYHGPGQLMMYWLVDLKRKQMGVRDFVSILEQAIIELLAGYGVQAHLQPGAPGVYVNHAKIASLGLRVRKGCTYHGLALNVQAGLEAFAQINPCGYQGLQMLNLNDLLSSPLSVADVAEKLLAIFCRLLAYQEIQYIEPSQYNA